MQGNRWEAFSLFSTLSPPTGEPNRHTLASWGSFPRRENGVMEMGTYARVTEVCTHFASKQKATQKLMSLLCALLQYWETAIRGDLASLSQETPLMKELCHVAKALSEASWWAHKVSMEREVLFQSWTDLNARDWSPQATQKHWRVFGRKAAWTEPAEWTINLWVEPAEMHLEMQVGGPERRPLNHQVRQRQEERRVQPRLGT